MLLFLADVPILLNGSAHTADTDINAAVFRVYHYSLFIRSVYDYYVPILIVGGLLCNIASVVVFGNNDVGGGGGGCGDTVDHATPTSQSPPASSPLNVHDSYDTYLTSRAVTDSVFLLCLAVFWLETVNIPLYTTAGLCQVRCTLVANSSVLGSLLNTSMFKKYFKVPNKYVGPPYCRAEMYAGPVARCPLVRHGEYADGTDKQRVRPTEARPLRYAFRYRESSEWINSSSWKACAWKWKQRTQNEIPGCSCR